MKTYMISLAALAAFSGSAVAQFSGNNQAPYSFDTGPAKQQAVTLDANPLESVDPVIKWYSGRYGMTNDPEELRRWSEKN